MAALPQSCLTDGKVERTRKPVEPTQEKGRIQPDLIHNLPGLEAVQRDWKCGEFYLTQPKSLDGLPSIITLIFCGSLTRLQTSETEIGDGLTDLPIPRPERSEPVAQSQPDLGLPRIVQPGVELSEG